MDWVSNYQLFLFDFDGLLVNTEQVHFLAYKKAIESRGYTWKWNFEQFCLMAHYGKERLFDALKQAYPGLHTTWEALYAEKQENMRGYLREGMAALMPGVETLLQKLENAQVKRCVVTNSPMEFMTIVRAQIPILNTIPNWVTREHYKEEKPHPECFLQAIDRFGEKGDKIVGFEDTPKGVRALLKTPAQPVFVTTIPYPEVDSFSKEGVLVLSSL